MAKRAKKAKTAKKGGAKRVVVTLLIIAAAIALLVFVADRISSKKELRNTRTTYGVENEGFKGIFLSAERDFFPRTAWRYFPNPRIWGTTRPER